MKVSPLRCHPHPRRKGDRKSERPATMLLARARWRRARGGPTIYLLADRLRARVLPCSFNPLLHRIARKSLSAVAQPLWAGGPGQLGVNPTRVERREALGATTPIGSKRAGLHGTSC